MLESTSDGDLVGSPNPEGYSPISKQEHHAYLVPLGIESEDGIYNAVVVSAFGGIKLTLDDKMPAKVHPFFIFLLCLPLFAGQISAILVFRLDLDLNLSVMGASERNPRLLFALKALMILVLQLANFRSMLNSLRLMVFLLNPITWFEVHHPRPKEWLPAVFEGRFPKVLFASYWLAPWSLCALAMKLGVAYLITIDSVSVILSCSNVQDAVFNSLAMMFIVDVNGHYWEFVRTVFHMSPIGDFEFKLNTDTWDIDGKLKQFKEHQVHWLMVHVIQRCSFLRIECGVRRLAAVMSSGCMVVVYMQQMFVVTFALDTDVLPMARDVCTMWRWQQGEALVLKKSALAFAFVIDHCLFFLNLKEEADHVVQREFQGQCSSEDRYYRMTLSDRAALAAKYPGAVFGSAVVIVCLFLLPEFVYFLYASVTKGIHGHAASKPGREDLLSKVEKLTSEVAQLREQVLRATHQL